MIDDEFLSLSEMANLVPFAELTDPIQNDHAFAFEQFAFEVPSKFFVGMDEAKISYDLMIQVSEKLQFAYHDLLRKIEIIK